jgi:hypothetical protein
MEGQVLGCLMREDSAHWFNICFLHINMTTRTERFQRKPREAQVTKNEAEEEPEEVVKFSPEEEAVCVGKHGPYICKDRSDTNYSLYSANPILKKPPRMRFLRNLNSKKL